MLRCESRYVLRLIDGVWDRNDPAVELNDCDAFENYEFLGTTSGPNDLGRSELHRFR